MRLEGVGFLGSLQAQRHLILNYIIQRPPTEKERLLNDVAAACRTVGDQAGLQGLTLAGLEVH